jgi:putative intracellular protease/amidase
MEIAIPLYPGYTVLDAVGPYEIISRLPGARVRWLAAEPGLMTPESGQLALLADAAYEDVPSPDLILVPGGTGTRDLLGDERFLAWLRGAHETSTWTTSVCTGSLLLGAAGILDGLRATSHWTELEALAEFGAIPTDERVVAEGKVVTAAGVSAGIDMGLWLAAQIAGEDFAKALQLMIEYDPQPPFDAGSTAKAGPELVALVRTAAESFRAANAGG